MYLLLVCTGVLFILALGCVILRQDNGKPLAPAGVYEARHEMISSKQVSPRQKYRRPRQLKHWCRYHLIVQIDLRSNRPISYTAVPFAVLEPQLLS